MMNRAIKNLIKASKTKGFKIELNNGETITVERRLARDLAIRMQDISDRHVMNEMGAGMMESRKCFVHVTRMITGA